ncbi:ribbon-helix-helix domain-containing protein, partial [Corynebacterium sp. ACRPQ]
ITSMVQGPHPSGRVVSVRTPEDIIERLDTLCARTGRSRGFYLKMAVTAMLPQLEEYHWEHVAADFEEKSIENEFYRIMLAGLSAESDDKEN